MSDKRGYMAALAGLVLQGLLIAVVLILRTMTPSLPLGPALWLVIAPAGFWLLTALLFYGRFLARREGEQLDQLREQAGPEGLFAPDEYARPAAKRQAWMERYFVPGFTLAMAAYHGVIAVLVLRWLESAQALPVKAPAGIFLAVGSAFAAFLLSRYALGMSKVEGWRVLRAPGSYLFADAAVFGLLAIGLGTEMADLALPAKVLAYVLSGLLALLAVEMLLNFVLDLYRPRVPGAEVRYSHDSRLLEILASPERVGHSISEALNYQFGFEVSKSWFYKLLSRALVPLVIGGSLILWLLTGLVIVEEGEEVVVLHWGTPRAATLAPRPAPYLVWPWPIDQTERFDTAEVRTLDLGVGGQRDPGTDRVTMPDGTVRLIYLWTGEHGERNELDTLVARPGARQAAGSEQIPSVNLVKIVATVYYRVDKPLRFGYSFVDAEHLLRSIAYRELTIYAASATLDEPLPAGAAADRPAGILSFGRAAFQKALADRITLAVSQFDLGVQIISVQLDGVHPPPEAAAAFEKVLAAEREQDKLRYAAQAEANGMLATVAGSPDRALRLAQAITFRRDFEAILNRATTGGNVRQAVEEAITRLGSEIAKLQREVALQAPAAPGAALPPTSGRQLMEAAKAHLKKLERIAADPAKADVAALVAAATETVESEFAQMQGMAALEVARARADRWKTEFRERALAETFNVELMGLAAAPNVYKALKVLDVLVEGLKDKPKYVLAVDPERVEVRVDLTKQAQALESINFQKPQ